MNYQEILVTLPPTPSKIHFTPLFSPALQTHPSRHLASRTDCEASKKSPHSPLLFKWINTLDGKQTTHTNSSLVEQKDDYWKSLRKFTDNEKARGLASERRSGATTEVMSRMSLVRMLSCPYWTQAPLQHAPWGVLGSGLHWAPGLATTASAGINLPCPRFLSHWNWICSG